jgi:hypothetical protein
MSAIIEEFNDYRSKKEKLLAEQQNSETNFQS